MMDERTELKLMKEDIEHRINKYNIYAQEMGANTIGLYSVLSRNEKILLQNVQSDNKSKLIETYNSMLGNSSMRDVDIATSLTTLNFKKNGDSICWRDITDGMLFTDNHGVIAKI